MFLGPISPNNRQANIEKKRFFLNKFTEEFISKLAQDETSKRQYYRPVYSLHKWWARRPGAQFRSIILLAVDPSRNLFTQSNITNTVSELSDYFQCHNLEDVIILDPFMGGGTTLIEANRLGAKVVGCDINPVSFWITREALKPIELEKLNAYFHQLEQSAGEQIKSLYRTRCSYCNEHADGLYVFWVRSVNCLACGETVYLFKRSLLNEGLSRNKPVSRGNPAIVHCSYCFALNEWTGQSDCCCKQCGNIFNPKTGTYDQGYYNCFHCKTEKMSLIQTLHSGQRLHQRIIAIEYWCPRCANRLYKSPDRDDLTKIEEIEHKFEECKEELTFPRESILKGASSARWRRHNYNYYYEVFNARQLLAFDYLINAIRTIPEEEYRNAFITIFSNSLEYNNMMTPYNYPHRKLHHLFNYHAMPLTTTPVENSVWGCSQEGAGTFVNCYKRYVNGKQYCQKPFDKFKDSSGKVVTVFSKSERIEANLVSSFEELKETPRSALLLCGDSSRLPVIPDKSIDFVITDPPYFDNIHYSELSNFFYVWLRCLIDHPYFIADHVPTEQEAIVNGGMNKNEESYKHLLTLVFQECKRVLKDEGLLIFTFHHTNWRAWWTVLSAIREGGFNVVDSFPVMSEYKVNPHIREKKTLDMDLVLICQKQSISVEQPSFSLEEITQRIMDNFRGQVYDDDKNRLFLYFMGELLKVASTNGKKEIISTYEQFEESLSYFHTYLINVSNGVKNEKELNYEQLTFFRE